MYYTDLKLRRNNNDNDNNNNKNKDNNKNQDFFLYKKVNIESSLGGLEPPTFRLTAERANRLRHRDIQYLTIGGINTAY